MRLFIALYPDKASLKNIAHMRDAYQANAEGKFVEDKQLHLTLNFLGDIESGQLESLKNIVNALPATPFTLAMKPSVFKVRKGQILALEAFHDSNLIKLRKDLVDTIAGIGIQPDRRTFKPHITLARRYKADHEKEKDDASEPETITVTFDRIVLVRSILKSHGATHQFQATKLLK